MDAYRAHRREFYYSLLKRHSPRGVIEILFALTATRGPCQG